MVNKNIFIEKNAFHLYEKRKSIVLNLNNNKKKRCI